MSTQDAADITVSYDRVQESFRLLELPSELLEMVTADPAAQLELKSAATDEVTGFLREPAYAVLCTATRTYQLRQVQTSNTVLITNLLDLDEDPERPAEVALSAVATCTSSLEVQLQAPQASTKIVSAETTLRKLLPVYNAQEDLHNAPIQKDQMTIFNDVPYSRQECEEAWTAEVAFEHNGSSWLPSAELLLDLWKAFSENMTMQGKNLNDVMPLTLARESLEDVEAPAELVNAFLICIFRLDKHYAENNATQSLDKASTINMLGKACVTISFSVNQDTAVWQVLQMWKNLLPEAWHENLVIKNVMEMREKIKAAESGEKQNGTGEEPGNGTKAPSTGRNWHERLKRAKR